jgi:anti-sigma factor RsiW
MQVDIHERCRLLIDRAILEGISPDEQRCVEAHKEDCPECRRYDELSRRTVQALRSICIAPDTAATLRVRRSVRLHAERLASAGAGSRSFFPVVVAAVCLTIVGSAAMWQTAAWVAMQRSIPPRSWQPGFTIFWVLPSIVLDAVLLFNQRLIARVPGRKGRAA